MHRFDEFNYFYCSGVTDYFDIGTTCSIILVMKYEPSKQS